jgi:WD40 repeat protein
VALSPDGKRLAVSQEGRGFIILDVATKNELLTVRAQTGSSMPVWSPDGRRLAMFDRLKGQEVVKAWDAETGKELFTLSTKETPGGAGNLGPGSQLSWSPDGRYFASADTVWELATGKVVLSVWPIMRNDRANSSYRTFKVFWETAGPRVATLKRYAVTWVARRGKHSRVITPRCWWRTRFWWRTPDPAGSAHLIAQALGAQPLALLAGPLSPLTQVLIAEEVVEVCATPEWDFRLTAAAAWSHDGQRLALAGGLFSHYEGPCGVGVWDVTTGRMTFWVGKQPRESWALAWDPADRRLAAAKGDGSLVVWEAATGQTLLKLPGHIQNQGPPLVALAWSPDGKRLASANEPRTATVWDAATGKEVFTLRGHGDNLAALAWSPDGKRLASGSVDSTIKLWDASSGKEVLTLRGYRGTVHSLAWSPDGRRLASVGPDQGGDESPGTLKLWDVATGQEIAAWERQAGPVTWSPDGRWLTSGAAGRYGTITVRGAPPPAAADEPAGK